MTLNAKPIIAFENLLAQGTLTASGSATGYPVDNVADYRSYTTWKSSGIGNPWVEIDLGSSRSANCLGIINHNANSAGATGILLQYYDGSWHNAHDAWSVSSDKNFFRTFDSCSGSKFKITFNSSNPIQAGIIMVGTYLKFPVYAEDGFDPDTKERVTTPQYSRAGQLLGVATEYTMRCIHANFRNLTQSFMDNTFLPFWDDHIPKPFIWAWDHNNHNDEVYWVALARSELCIPYHGIARSLGLKMQGVSG